MEVGSMQLVFDHPPASMQSQRELRECYSWLYRLSEQLNAALQQTDAQIRQQSGGQVHRPGTDVIGNEA